MAGKQTLSAGSGKGSAAKGKIALKAKAKPATKVIEVKLRGASKSPAVKKEAAKPGLRAKAAAKPSASSARSAKVAVAPDKKSMAKKGPAAPIAAKGGGKKSNETAAAPVAASRKSTGIARQITVEATSALASADKAKNPFPPPSAAALKAFRKVSQQQRLQAHKAKTVVKGDFLAKPPAKGKKYTLDLRIHSPGTLGYFSSGGVDPGPALVRLAKVKGLDLIAVADYYNAEFIDIVRAAAGTGGTPSVLAGVDLCCAIGACREVYVTALFPENYGTREVSGVLEELGVPAEAKGRKDYCLETPFRDVVRIVEKHSGLLIPSRVDKTPYRQLAIPTLVNEFGIRAFDLVHPDNTEYFRERWPGGGFVFFSFSNANALAQIGTRTAKVKLSTPDFAGLKEVASRARPVQ